MTTAAKRICVAFWALVAVGTGAPTPAVGEVIARTDWRPACVESQETAGESGWATDFFELITCTATDSLGLAAPSPATGIITVVAPGGVVIPKTNWRLLYVDSQETAGENGLAANSFDSNNYTIWHTKWTGVGDPLPHEIQIDLRALYEIDGFRYLPRQDGSINGRIGQYEFYVSTDGITWGSPVAKGTFANSSAEKEVRFTPAAAQFIRLRALTEVNGKPFTSMAEIAALGTLLNPGNQPPNGVIDTPSQNVTINAGGIVTFAGSGTDPDNNLPLSFRWNFGNGSGIPDSTLKDPGAVRFNAPGTYTVTFTVADSLGLIDPSPATRIITVVAPGGVAIPKTNWRLLYVDSQETVGENGLAANSFDSNSHTIWHTKWTGVSAPLPHEIQINLRALYEIDGFRYLPRQDGETNGRIGQYEFHICTDGITWGSPVAKGTFANSSAEKEVRFTPTAAQFIRLRALTEVNGKPFTSMAEIAALGTLLNPGNQPPNGVIDTPSQNVTINAGGIVTFAGSGTDPDNNLPLSFRWNFGNGSGIPDSTLKDPGAVRFNTPGSYAVTFTVTDSLGLADPSPAARIVTVVAPGGVAIPKTNWRLLYVDSQETVGENGLAANSFDSNSHTIWHTKWTGVSAPLPHEIQIDLGALYDIDGFRYLPRQDGGINGRIGQYEFYVSTDGITWGSPVATGPFANSSAEKEVRFTPAPAQFIRLRALTEANGRPFTSMAELTLLGALLTGNPDGVIKKPAKDLTIAVGGTVTFAGKGIDPENNLPLTFRWDFGYGSGILNSTLKDPGAVQFNIPGIYAVTFTVADSLGLPDLSPATRVITVLNRIPETIPDWAFVSSSPLNPINPTEITNPVLTALNVIDAPASFIADPFLFYENGMWYLFFEAYLNSTQKGSIGLARSSDGFHWVYDRIVLSTPWHLSYPYVFKHNGKYYMIPESANAYAIQVYEAVNFPYNWRNAFTIASGRFFVDSSIFRFNNLWWLFTYVPTTNSLHLYYSDDLLNGWVEHPKSPVISGDPSRARPAGRSFVFDTERIVRTAQKNDLQYGEQVRAFEVDVLTKTDYAEHEIAESPLLDKSGIGWNSLGMHHFDPWWTGNRWICAVDGHNQQAWSIGLYVVASGVK